MNAAAQTFLEKTVAEVMSTDLITLKLNDTLRLADDMFNLAQVRHFPVLDGDNGRRHRQSRRSAACLDGVLGATS